MCAPGGIEYVRVRSFRRGGVPLRGATLVVGAPKFKGGGPTRVLALV